MKKIFCLFAMLSVALVSCDDEPEVAENCVNYKRSKISEVVLEDTTVNVNEDLPIELTYELVNSCGNFYDFEVNRDVNNYVIKVKSKYEGCTCNEMISSKNTTYYFRSTQTGVYTLHFSVSNDQYITKTVTVI